jgi:hypothetical protein
MNSQCFFISLALSTTKNPKAGKGGKGKLRAINQLQEVDESSI